MALCVVVERGYTGRLYSQTQISVYFKTRQRVEVRDNFRCVNLAAFFLVLSVVMVQSVGLWVLFPIGTDFCPAGVHPFQFMSIESKVGRSVKLTGAELGDWSCTCTHVYALVACGNNLAVFVASTEEIIRMLLSTKSS
jgi:hypothetical protein